jgi:hypothetical protein
MACYNDRFTFLTKVNQLSPYLNNTCVYVNSVSNQITFFKTKFSFWIILLLFIQCLKFEIIFCAMNLTAMFHNFHRGEILYSEHLQYGGTMACTKQDICCIYYITVASMVSIQWYCSYGKSTSRGSRMNQANSYTNNIKVYTTGKCFQMRSCHRSEVAVQSNLPVQFIINK